MHLEYTDYNQKKQKIKAFKNTFFQLFCADYFNFERFKNIYIHNL